jgi:hypothetical protein
LDGCELGDDPAATYRDSADLVVAAFTVADIAERRMVLEKLPGPLPAPVAISFHFTDFLVHGWDVARSIGAPFQAPPELITAALGLASRIPDEARGPGAAFGPVVEVSPTPATTTGYSAWSAATRPGPRRPPEVADPPGSSRHSRSPPDHPAVRMWNFRTRTPRPQPFSVGHPRKSVSRPSRRTRALIRPGSLFSAIARARVRKETK